jgi:ATP-dependent DNA helicase RecG
MGGGILMKLKESETVELKKSSAELNDAVISISAILNKHHKGVLYFGIKTDGSPVKNVITDKTLRDISQKIAEKIEPKIYPTIQLVTINKIDVIKVTFQGEQVPYSADGKYFIRVADEDRKMSAAELKNFFISNSEVRWDKTINPDSSLNDISIIKVKDFCNTAGIKFTSLINVLDSVGLLSKNKLLNAALILFGKAPEKIFFNAKLICSVFASTNTANIIDQKEFQGDLFYLLKEAEKYILKNINIGMKVEGLYRKDIPEINQEALREALINAFLHRDYYDPDFISLFIFKDRIEIRNPGSLFGGLTIKDILRKHISKRRNEVIADIFNRAHLGERKGRGISLILEKEPDTVFESIGQTFITTLKRKHFELSKELVDGLVDGLVETQRKIILLMSDNPKISIRELHNQIGISTTAIDKHIIKLKNMGIIQRIGSAKSGYWKIVTK